MSYTEKINNRRIFGGTDDVVQLYPIKYPVPWQMYLDANKNHWLPQEISMQQDINQWRANDKLTERDRHLIKTALGFFTTADSLVANNLVLNVYRHTSSPECRMYLLRQAYEEAIHSHAYQYIVESLGLDESEIFEMYTTNQSIARKDDYVLQAAQVLNQERIGVTEYISGLAAFYVVMEGIFFYAAFAGIFQLAIRNLMPGVQEQFQYILRDETMHMNFGMWMIRQALEELPGEARSTAAGVIARRMEAMVGDAISREMDFTDEMFGGSAPPEYKEFIQYVAATRLAQMGMGPVPIDSNPLPWMASVVELPKKKNFFETRVTDYQTGGALQWD